MLYGAASIAIIETLAQAGHARGIYVRPNHGTYVEVFRGALALSATGAGMAVIAQPLLDGSPEDRKTALIAQQGLDAAIALLNTNF